MRFSTTIPALPVRDVERAIACYVEQLGFTCVHSDTDFAVVVRDGATIHLWGAHDERWRTRDDLADRPVRSGAESFIAGTASCRVQVEGVDEVHREMAAAQVLHPVDPGQPVDSDWGTREVAVLDLDGNLLTFFEPVG